MRHIWMGVALLTLGGAGCAGSTNYAYDTQKVIAGHNKTQAMVEADTGFYEQAAQSKRREVQARADAKAIGYF